MSSPAPWPELRVAAWRDTYQTLLLYSQVVGKIRLALAPKTNQWWNVTLYVTARGLTTSPMPYGDRLLQISLDFIDHRVIVEDSDGNVRSLALAPRAVCIFYAELMSTLAGIGVDAPIWPQPQECPVTTPFTDDLEHAHYDRAAVKQFWQALRRIEPVFQLFRSRFRGKCSPVHFFWGAFDLAVTRFVGRRAPLRKAKVDRDAYDEEVISLGFWPGDPWAASGATDALFYSYTVPEPAGLAAAPIHPAAAVVEPDAEGIHPALRRRPPRGRSSRRDPGLRAVHLRRGRDARRVEPRSARLSVGARTRRSPHLWPCGRLARYFPSPSTSRNTGFVSANGYAVNVLPSPTTGVSGLSPSTRTTT